MKPVFLILLIFQFACSSNEHGAAVDSTTETEALKKLEYDAIDAEFKLDTAAIAAVMHEKFISIDVNGIGNKSQELTGIYNNISRRLKEGHVVDSFYLDQFRADFFNQTAIVTFFTVTKGKMNGQPYENRRTRFYDVWIKNDTQWKMVSMQATPVSY